MLKRILILLGETASSVLARRYAFRLAQDMDVGIAGLAGIDLSYIEAPMPGAAGAMDYVYSLSDQLKREADTSRRRLHETYERECREHGLPFEWLSFEGDPVETLQLAAETRDLVVTGHDTAFCGGVSEPLSEVLGRLLQVTPRPVIVCGDQPAADAGDVLIAYDGSAPAMRAVQLFAMLGIGCGRRVLIASVDANEELAARRAAGAASYLRSHGYQAEGIPVRSTAEPEEVLRVEVADRKIGLLVMGAYGHRGLRALLFGSTTRALVEDPPCPLFLYH